MNNDEKIGPWQVFWIVFNIGFLLGIVFSAFVLPERRGAPEEKDFVSMHKVLVDIKPYNDMSDDTLSYFSMAYMKQDKQYESQLFVCPKVCIITKIK